MQKYCWSSFHPFSPLQAFVLDQGRWTMSIRTEGFDLRERNVHLLLDKVVLIPQPYYEPGVLQVLRWIDNFHSVVMISIEVNSVRPNIVFHQLSLLVNCLRVYPLFWRLSHPHQFRIRTTSLSLIVIPLIITLADIHHWALSRGPTRGRWLH